MIKNWRLTGLQFALVVQRIPTAVQ